MFSHCRNRNLIGATVTVWQRKEPGFTTVIASREPLFSWPAEQQKTSRPAGTNEILHLVTLAETHNSSTVSKVTFNGLDMSWWLSTPSKDVWSICDAECSSDPICCLFLPGVSGELWDERYFQLFFPVAQNAQRRREERQEKFQKWWREKRSSLETFMRREVWTGRKHTLKQSRFPLTDWLWWYFPVRHTWLLIESL